MGKELAMQSLSRSAEESERDGEMFESVLETGEVENERERQERAGEAVKAALRWLRVAVPKRMFG
jgi:hypothetical protein